MCRQAESTRWRETLRGSAAHEESILALKAYTSVGLVKMTNFQSTLEAIIAWFSIRTRGCGRKKTPMSKRVTPLKQPEIMLDQNASAPLYRQIYERLLCLPSNWNGLFRNQRPPIPPSTDVIARNVRSAFEIGSTLPGVCRRIQDSEPIEIGEALGAQWFCIAPVLLTG